MIMHSLPLDQTPSSVPSTGFLFNSGCHDLSVSGHAGFSVLAALFSLQSPNIQCSTIRQGFVIILSLLSCLSNILVGDHLTNEVMIGVIIAALIHQTRKEQFKQTFLKKEKNN